MAFWKIFGKKKTPQELMVAGDLKGALKGFKALIKEKKQTDPALLMQLANVQTKMGKLDDAKATYIRVGEHYGDAGFFNKSVAAFKKALNLFPDDQVILDKLASYNDKVPKFMIDERFLRKINRWEEEVASGAVDPETVEAARRAYEEGQAAEAGDALMETPDLGDALPGETDLKSEVDVSLDASGSQNQVDIDMSFLDSDGDGSLDPEPDEAGLPAFEEPNLSLDFGPSDDGMEAAPALSDEPVTPDRVTGPVIPTMDEFEDPYGFTRDDDEDDPQGEALADQQPDFSLDDQSPGAVNTEVPPEEKARTLAGVEAFKAALTNKDADTGQLHAARAAYEPTDIDDSGNRMVFKAAIEETPVAQKPDASYESVDDALDSLFGGAGGDDDDGGLFGNLGPAAEAAPAPEPEPEPVAATPEPEPVAAAPEPEPVAAAPTSQPVALAGEDESVDNSMTSEIHFLDDDDDFVNPFDSASEEENQRHWALFRTMPKEVFTAFVVALDMRDYEPGEFLMRQGDEGDEMFLLSEGRVAVEIEKDGDLVKVAELGEGDFVGEASLLTGGPRNASVRADENTTCLILSKADLQRLTKDHPSVIESIKSIYYTRVSQNASRFSRQEQTQA